MHFEDPTPRHRQLRQQVATFADEHVTPRIEELEHGDTVDEELIRLIAAQGWIAPTVPKKLGGMGGDYRSKTIIIEEFSKRLASVGAAVQASILGYAMIVFFGRNTKGRWNDQARYWLPKIGSGEVLPTIAVTEPHTGSDLLGMESTAVRDGDEYVIIAHKAHVGNSPVGRLHCVVALTGPKQLSAFLVPASRPGCYAKPPRQTVGLRNAFGYGELEINTRVPASNRLGREGDGLDAALAASTVFGQSNLAAVSLGIQRAIHEDAEAFASARQRRGAPLNQISTVEQRLGAIKSRLITSRNELYHAVEAQDRGKECDELLYNAKLVNFENSIESAGDAMRNAAAWGTFMDLPFQRYLRDAWCIYSPAGTSDFEYLRLARAGRKKRKQYTGGFARAGHG